MTTDDQIEYGRAHSDPARIDFHRCRNCNTGYFVQAWHPAPTIECPHCQHQQKRR